MPSANSTTSTRVRAAPAVLDVALMAGGVFVLAAGFKALTGNVTTASSLWLANGFALGLLLTAPRPRWPLLLAAALVAGAGSAVYLDHEPALIPWISLVNGLEVLFAAMTVGAIRTAEDLTDRRRFLRFLGCAVLLAPLLLVAALTLFNLVTGQPFTMALAQRIFIGHALGMAVMTPVVLALRNGELRQYLQPATVVESLLTLGLVAAVCLLVFLEERVPLLFLIFLPLMRVAYRGGFVGTAIAILMVVAIGAVATALGQGPIAAMESSGRLAAFPLLSDGYFVLQVFTAALLVSLFPMIVSITEGRRAHGASEQLQYRLKLLMNHSSDVIILTDIEGRRLYVSPGVREVVGVDPAEFVRLTWRDYVHEADAAEVGRQIAESQRTRTSRVLVFRINHVSGALVWIEAHMKYFHDREEGFVITMRDITARRRAELELEAANAELASLVRKDALTGLANRRSFDEELESAWEGALRGGWPLAVLMIDVDHFKQFNDCYGHQRGDLCLRDVAVAILSGLFHPDDVAARYGGEEFAVILPRTSTDNAAQVAERIRRAVQELQRPHVAAPLGAVTVSVGVAAARPVSRGDPLSVVRAADEALYTSKHEGRNRTTVLEVAWPDEAPTAGAS